MKHSKHRHAFTMIELLFVIVIIGIVGGIALEAVRQYYEGIYRTGEYSKRVADADQMLELISKYFEFAVSDSIVVRDQDAATACVGPPPTMDDGHDYTVAFVMVDSEGLNSGAWDGARWRPGWSSMGESNGTNFSSPDSSYTSLDALSALTGSIAIYRSENTGIGTVCSRYNWDGGVAEASTVYRVIQAVVNNTNVTLNGVLSVSGGVDKGHLMRSAYAFRAIGGDFNMYSDFQPWNGDGKEAGKMSLIGKNVAHFTILYDNSNTQVNSNIGNVYTLKLCMKGLDNNLSTTEERENQICRERTIRVRY